MLISGDASHLLGSGISRDFTILWLNGHKLRLRAPTITHKQAWLRVLDGFLSYTPDSTRMLLPDVYLTAIHRCIAWLTQHGCDDEGIFRTSATQHACEHLLQQLLVDAIDQQLENILPVADAATHVRTVACVLKLLLRRMPETLLTTDLSPLFYAAAATHADVSTCVQHIAHDNSRLVHASYV